MKTQLTFTKKTLWLLIFTFVTTVAIHAQQVINTTLQHDGKTRQYRLYIPASYDASKPAPLILNFHGFTNNINVQYNQSDFRQLAEDNQFIFVTPQGLGFLAGWAINNNFGGNEDDLGFSNALIDKIESEFNINPKRIYATGFSNGGFFSYRLACELSPRIAAVASVAGSMTRRWIDRNQCQPQHPTAVLQITGTRDNTISINGNGSNEPIQDVMEYWSANNNGDATPEVIQLGGGSTRSIWDNGDNGVTAEFIRVQGKGHSWNGGNVNTSEEIWKFFSRFDIDGEIGTNPNPTACTTTIESFPYNESFETNLGAWSNATSGDDINWTRDSGGTPSSQTGPSNGADGDFYVYVEASGNNSGFPNKSAILNSPCLNFTSLTTPTLTFQYHMFGSAINSLEVEARTDNTGAWTTVFSKNGTQGNNWIATDVDLAAYAGNASVQLRFNVVTGSGNSGWQSDIAIDAISIQNGSGGGPDPVCEALNFNDFTIDPFTQDRAGDFSIGNSGNALTLTNNTWKYILMNYDVTANTVIEFDFSSTNQGEIHGLGFEDNNSLTSSRYFKVHGTQNYGVTNYDNYSSGTTKYIIPVGNFYTGSMDRLVFINDNDAGSGNNSTFSNVRIYEGTCGGALIAQIPSDFGKVTPILGTDDEEISSFATLYPNPTNDQFSLNISSENTKNTIVKIFNTLGQKEYEAKLKSGINNFSANSLELSSGIYIVKIKSERSEEIVKKLIIN
ncbi:T9SS C-terminal target domain-containing protein [Aquimarina sp. AD10]|uniref:T9SS type A sorting domain-containing protein n=1 Tax=Aquimarina sp. AD10 TaxID=1714849 RepID=UPI000E4EB0C9|nr:T9SS type A sorting domain-containing protein [Aquimarina sp. AD10]AXT59581.1 T9SS C-terminal target domain-containing protein [Aquimarina sp. AD10]RKM92419.1 T9SS C-terminal target domain-containing protein [Aquimarina sp. AD10]